MALLGLRALRPVAARLPAFRAESSMPALDHINDLGSTFEDYDATSKTYDTFRRQVGMDVLNATLATVAERMGAYQKDLKLADFGCGSGTYLAALRYSVKAIAGVEANTGMIAEAERKLGRDVVVRGSITSNPFGDATFDAALTTQVIHHLEPRGTEGDLAYPIVARALSESFRVLKPGGAYCLNTTSPRQHVDGFWWAPIVPAAIATQARRMPPIDRLQEMLVAAGFETVETHVPPEAMIYDDKYLDVRGPFRREWRDADSTWALATPDELAAGLAAHRARVDDGTADAWLAKREALRAEVGQTTTLVAWKA
jgi:SAM-dependent methyltransferase